MGLLRQQIVDAVVARLKQINGQPNYHTNFQQHVFDYRTTTINDEELPAINVQDDDEKLFKEQSKGGAQVIDWDLTLTVDIVFKTGSASVSDLRKGLADVYKAIGADISFGGLVEWTTIQGDHILKTQDESVVTGARAIIHLFYRTTKWQEN